MWNSVIWTDDSFSQWRKPEVRIWSESTEVGIMLTCPVSPFFYPVTIRPPDIWRDTQNTYPILMSLAWKSIEPQRVGSLIEWKIWDPKKWSWMRNQYAEPGSKHFHLLVETVAERCDWILFGFTDSDNSSLISIELQEWNFSPEAFDLLKHLRESVIVDNNVHGHWHDRWKVRNL